MVSNQAANLHTQNSEDKPADIVNNSNQNGTVIVTDESSVDLKNILQSTPKINTQQMPNVENEPKTNEMTEANSSKHDTVICDSHEHTVSTTENVRNQTPNDNSIPLHMEVETECVENITRGVEPVTGKDMSDISNKDMANSNSTNIRNQTKLSSLNNDTENKENTVSRVNGISTSIHEAISADQNPCRKEIDDLQQLRPMAAVLFNIGLGLVLQSACQAKRRRLLKAKKKSRKQDSDIDETRCKLDQEYDVLISKLVRFQHAQKRCKGCGFRTEINNALELHNEFGHGQDEMQFGCALCTFSSLRESEFIFHLEAEHNRVGRIQSRKALYECPLCPFENRNSAVFNKHVMHCKKTYNPKRNLEPMFGDTDIPLKKQKQDRVTIKELSNAGHKMAPIIPIGGIINRANNVNVKPTKLSATAAGAVIGSVRPVGPPQSMPGVVISQPTKSGPQKMQVVGKPPKSVIFTGSSPPPRLVQIGNQWYSLMPSADKTQFTAMPVSAPLGPVLPPPQSQVTQGSSSAARLDNAKAVSVGQKKQFISQMGPATKPAMVDPMESIINAAVAAAIAGNAQNKQLPIPTPAPIVIAPTASQGSSTSTSRKKNVYEVCEICDGFVKDRASLHQHFEISHKVKMDIKMFTQRQPILSCLKCTKRFWTYQGLSKHSKVEHGTMVSTAQPLPSSQTVATHHPMPAAQPTATFPTYTCSICGEKRIRFVLSHLKAKHHINVPEILAMKQCPCCGLSCSSAESVFVHIEAKHPEIVSDPALKMYQLSCQFCLAKFTTALALEEHCNTQHSLVCPYCPERFPGTDFLHGHISLVHRNERKLCRLCGNMYPIGAAFIHHVKTAHLRECFVQVTKLTDVDLTVFQSEKHICENDSQEANGNVRTDYVVEID